MGIYTILGIYYTLSIGAFFLLAKKKEIDVKKMISEISTVDMKEIGNEFIMVLKDTV